jgi:hypothetical protein
MRQQGAALSTILEANRADADPANDIVLSAWPEKDQALMSIASNQMLTERITDAQLPATDREDLATILGALRKYVAENAQYWRERGIRPQLRFEGWNPAAEAKRPVTSLVP